jgi:hypothetical protein
MGLPRVLGCWARLLDRGKKWGKPMARYIPGIEDPISGHRGTRLRPPRPGPRRSCRAFRGTWPDVLLLLMTRYPAGVGPDFRPPRDPISGHRGTGLRPPSPGPRQSCRACRGTCPDALLLSMTRFPARGHAFLAGEDPFPATVQGAPARLPGALGLRLRGEGEASICRARAEVRQPQRAPHRGWRPRR